MSEPTREQIAEIARKRQLKRDRKTREKPLTGTYLKHARYRESVLDYEKAIEIYEQINMPKEAARLRKIIAEQKKVEQTVVQGDQITKTEIKDSVLNRSNVGGGSSKIEELEKIIEMKKEGFIDDDEFKQMKKEILGK